jgi:hypothetical protein
MCHGLAAFGANLGRDTFGRFRGPASSVNASAEVVDDDAGAATAEFERV